MRLSTRMRYGTRALVDLALSEDRAPVTTAEIAERQEISPKYLEQLLTTLRNAGLVRSMRGAQGGHTLARRPEDISLREIYQHLEGPDCLVDCSADPRECHRSDRCPTREVWTRMYTACMEVLEATSLRDLVEEAKEKRESTKPMYYI